MVGGSEPARGAGAPATIYEMASKLTRGVDALASRLAALVERHDQMIYVVPALVERFIEVSCELDELGDGSQSLFEGAEAIAHELREVAYSCR